MRAMPWPETSVVKQRHEFVLRALEPGANISDLAREHGISRKTAYKWLERFRERGVLGLEDLSRRPRSAEADLGSGRGISAAGGGQDLVG